MKKRWIFFLIVVCSSCWQSKVSDDKVTHIADLECRAITLREQRFALANKIRFTQDTLLHFKTATDTVRLNDSLHFFLQEKEILLQSCLQLADTIHEQLDSLRKFSFKNIDEKHAFDEKLKAELEKRRCNQ